MGTAILQHFVLTFDQRNHLMRIRHEGANPIHPPPLLGTGLVFNPKHGGLQVVRVLDGSPAEAAGIRKGDTVTAVDGRSVHQRECGSFGQRFTADDEEVVLTIKRGGVALDITVGIVEIIP
jgi:S1-C subfamily serine protease